VAQYVKSIDGSIGYVEYAYAIQNNMTDALVLNRAAEFVQAGTGSFQAAAAGADWSKAPSFYLILTDQPGKGAWPITGSVFILMYKSQNKPDVARAILKFFDWVYSADGDKLAASLDYVPLPPTVVKQIQAAWKAQIKDASGKPL
jgi:phosphate transport system substrate-binding protein